MKIDSRDKPCVDPAIGELLVPYALGTLNADEAARFEDHLIACSFCQTELEAGYEPFAKLGESRSEILRQMKDSGEDFESLFARMREPVQPRQQLPEELSLEGRWRKLADAVLNPWVYGPLVAATAAVILIVHLTARGPSGTLTPPARTLPSPISQNYLLHAPAAAGSSLTKLESQADQMKPLTKASPPTDMAEPLAERIEVPKPPSEAAKIVPVPQEQADRAERVPLPTPKLDIASKSTRRMAEPMSGAGVQQESRVVVLRDELSLPDALHDSALAMLRVPPAYMVTEGSFPKNLETRPARAGRRSDVAGSGMTKEVGALSYAAPKTSDSARVRNFQSGMNAYRRMDFVAAATALTQSAYEDSSNVNAWFYLGAAELQNHQWASAVHALTVADSLSRGNDPRIRYYLSLGGILSRNLEKARQWIGSISSRPDSLGRKARELQLMIDRAAPHK